MGMLFVTAIAAAAADTAASELGVMSRNPVLITRPTLIVAPGTNGGISTRGQGYALLAATYTLVLGWLLFAISTVYAEGGREVEWLATHSWLLPLGAIMGFMSCQVDSLLGATLENRGYLSKNDVNFVSITITTLVTYLLLVTLA
jgi:uncharacterized protein (TIGR00297 family)